MKAVFSSGGVLLGWGVVCAVITCLPAVIGGNDFAAFLLAGFVDVGVLVLVMVVFAVRVRQRPAYAVLMLALFFCLGFLLSRAPTYRVHDEVRWLTMSGAYERQVLSQPASANSLRHVEWDGWGMAGTGDTTVYLVFDPDDTLSRAAGSGASGKFAGLPCNVVRVSRRGQHWYTVLFYTDTDWDDCGEAGSV